MELEPLPESLESLDRFHGQMALDPEEWELETLLNAPVLQSLMEDYAKLTLTVTAIVDLKGKVLVAVGWQDICTKFHRAHACSAQNCTESDLYLAGNVQRGEYVAYKCKNGLWDVVTPLYVADTHMGNIYTGQFFYDDEVVDREFFAAQAEGFGYDKAEYLEALDRVPRFTRDQVKRLMDFLVKFTDLVSRFTLSNLRSVAFIREQARSASALRKSEAALRESQAMLALVLDTIPQSVFWKGQDGKYLGCNKAFAEAAGFEDPAQVVGRTDFEMPWLREEAEAYRADDRQVLESGQSKLHIEECIHRSDGACRLIETSKSPLLDANGEPFAVLGIYEDITEQRHAEEERERLQTQLQQVQKMESLGNLAGGVAHDINNVLGAILALATANIDSQVSGSAARRAFETIIQAAERGGKMVKSLLSFARKTAAELKPVDLNRIMGEEASLLERTTLSRIRVVMDLAPNLPLIQGDESALAHAIMNLCVNAVDAMGDNGTLTLRTQNLEKGGVELQVQDTGAGMSKEVLDRAMDPFFTTKEVGKGTGLGLSMVYSTVKAHQGQIYLESAPGAGTCVKLHFPVSTPQVSAMEKAEVVRAESKARALRVLVIDDDELIRISMEILLESMGHHTILSESGEDALSRLEDGLEVDCVILDMNMPGLGGAGTLPCLRALRPELPVLLATGRVDQSALDLVATDPHTALLSKPFTRDEIGTRFGTLLKQNQAKSPEL